VADLRRVCPGCRTRFRPAKGTRRLYCETCRPSRVRPGSSEPATERPSDEPGDLERVVRAELERVDRLEWIEGVALLALARDADKLAGAQRAAAIRELVRLKPQVFAGTLPPERDRRDDLADRRAERFTA